MKCASKTKAGKRCGANAVHGTRFCNMHTSGRAQELGARGGRRRARFNTEELPAIAPPQNVGDVLRALGQVFSEVHAGKLEPKVANACAYLASGILAAVTAGQFEERIAALEKRHKVMEGVA